MSYDNCGGKETVYLKIMFCLSINLSRDNMLMLLVKQGLFI